MRLNRTQRASDRRIRTRILAILALALSVVACSSDDREPRPAAALRPPSILFVTLDTTRADRLGFESERFETPSIDALAARGVTFSHAYATAPTTLPSHASMFTGRYPAAHGVHENGRYVSDDSELLAVRLRELGYDTAAVISGYPLARQFGLARGFEHFDDDFGEAVERDAAQTTDLAIGLLARRESRPLFLWVHYFDPHEPYEPPEPFASRHRDDPYQGEIAFMDHHLGRLVAAFEERAGESPVRIAVIGDHGEGLGEHGEALHGRLLYQATMRVPLVVAGSGIQPGRVERAVSAREAYGTLLGWAEGNHAAGWLDDGSEPVLGEALKPHLQYGWQPQVMGVLGTLKVIRSGDLEVFDLAADPGETTNLAGSVQLDRRLQTAVREYPITSGRQADDSSSGAEALGAEATKKLASLGYFDSGSRQQARENAPNPKDMTHVFRDLDIGSGLFVREQYAQAIPFFERALAADSENLAVTLQLAVAHSVLGEEQRADHYFGLAQSIDPASIDLRHYHAMHLFRFGRWEDAAPLFESVLAEMPTRLPALERMAEIREKEGRLEEARRYLERAVALAPESVDDLTRLGELSMAVQDTAAAIRAFERARDVAGDRFTHFLELGVCYLAAGRVSEAAETLDRVPRLHPGHPMALFKRAQAAVLLNEPDWRDRVRRAYASSDETTRRLIESEPLFRGFTGAPGAGAR